MYTLRTTNIAKAEPGDIAVFEKNGGISHSNIYIGDGKFAAKDGEAEFKESTNLAQQEKDWGKCVGYYFKKGDVELDIKSDDGRVSAREMRKELKKLRKKKKRKN